MAKHNMDDVDRKADRAYVSASRRSQKFTRRPARERSGRTTGTLLFAAAIAVVARLPVTAGSHGPNHVLSTSVCARTLSSPTPANRTALADNATDPDFDWQSLQPSTDIQWAPCFDGHQCARLLLPLDYHSNGTSNATTAFALHMIPARDRTNHRGTVLPNPGGPGYSGTVDDFMGALGPNISTIVGDSFDVLGFDPRGVGASTPRLDCFATQADRDIWNMQEGHQLLNASDEGVLDFYSARAKVVGTRCAQRSAGQGDIARFMDTGSVATDMLKIVEKLGQEKL